MLDVYHWFHNEILAIPSIKGKTTEKEKFAGAEYTLTNEALMYNGVALQSGTSHYFGQKFSKAYNVKFTNKEKIQEIFDKLGIEKNVRGENLSLEQYESLCKIIVKSL